MNKKQLQNLTRHEFDLLKLTGFLWEFYPNAPESYDELTRQGKETGKVCGDITGRY